MLLQICMTEIGVYTATIIAILGIPYPIILQVISKLDDTYGSTLIIELFEHERILKWFQWHLYASLISILIWSWKQEPIYPFSELGWIIDNSGSLLVILNTVLLVIAFIRLVRRLFIYSVPSRIVEHLIQKHNEGKD